MSFFFGWMNYNPFKSFSNGPPPPKKKKTKVRLWFHFLWKRENCILGIETHYLNQNWNFKAKVIHLYLLAEEACEKANNPECVCRKRIGELEALGRKIPHARQTSKMAQHNLFFFLMLKCTEFFWKYLLERGKKKWYYIQERKEAGWPRSAWHGEVRRHLGTPSP